MTRTCRLFCLALALVVSVGTPALADSYLVYGDGGIPPGSNLFTWCDSPPCDVSEPVVCNNPEGGASLRVITNVWGGWGIFLPQPEDLSAYAGGELRFFVKAPTAGNVKVEFACSPPNSPDHPNLAYGTSIGAHGWDGTTNWQELVIPLTDSSFECKEGPAPGLPCDPPRPLDLECLATVDAPFLTTIENLPSVNGFLVDRVRWHAPNTTHTGASSVQVQGRQLLVDGEPFVVNGVAYAPISIGENWQGAWRDRPDRYLVDFPLMAANGANAVRLYAPLLSTPMLDAAWAAGLYVIPTFGVSPVQLECPEGKDFMRDQFVGEVLEWKDHPAILFWLVGNETNTNLGAADLCLDWYPQLDSMALAAHNAEGTSFHPVGTGSAEVDDICVAGCSDDLTLPNVDFWGAQLYRGCTFGSPTTAFDEYSAKPNCDRPLIVTEFGADAYDSMLGAEDQDLQASCLDSLMTQATGALAVRTTGGVSSGQVVFEWCDEWWKADETCGTGWEFHDGCTSFSNFGYPDPGINEEWWGVVSQTDSNPDERGLRTAYTTLADSWWQLGSVLDLRVVSHDSGTGETTLSFDPAVGADDHTVYWGPLNALPSYGYSGSSLVDGSNSVTLPGGSLFWVVVGRTDGAEGCYGNDSACAERPASSGASVPQTANRTCECSSP